MSISNAVAPSAVARVVGIATAFKNLRGAAAMLPQRIGVVGQGNTAAVYALEKYTTTSASAAGSRFGFGSPIHQACLKLLPANGDGVGTIPVTIFPMEDDGSGVASAGDVTPGGSPTVAASYIVRINNIDSEAFVISVGDAVADIVTAMTNAINAVLEMPVVATDSTTVVDLESKWKGTSANDIYVEVVGSTTAGNTFAITQPVGGLVNPDVDDALAMIGNVWETMLLNCMEMEAATLDKFSTWGEGRWGATVRKPVAGVFHGSTEAVVATAITITDARKTDRTNSQLVNPGSNDLPVMVAARQLARIAVVANSNPAHDYGSQSADGLTPGDDADQWDWLQRDQAVKGGSSTTESRDGVVTVMDVVTMYHPTGDDKPAYRKIVQLVKIQNTLFNLDLIYNSTEWDGAPLVPDDQAVSNRTAKKPSMATTATAAMIDSLGLEAIISDPASAKASIESGISTINGDRLEQTFTAALSGNVDIVSIDFNFGFFFGDAVVVA